VQWFMKHSEAEDLNLLATARQQVIFHRNPGVGLSHLYLYFSVFLVPGNKGVF
jgi:hypothetical protein